ncbi:MAG: hypothetical protein AABZ55_11610 [Bdellovibrionota bacterium]
MTKKPQLEEMEKTNPFLMIKRESGEKNFTLHLAGVIDENSNLDEVIGPVKGKIRIGCKGIARVNSFGVRHWIKYFRKLADMGIEYSFFECSPVIVDQINTVGDFMAGGKVESIYLPYTCEGCKKTYYSLFKLKNLEKTGKAPSLSNIECPVCHSSMEFDEVPENYFQGFIKQFK